MGELQFDRAEYAPETEFEEGPFYCVGCKVELTGTYYEVRGKDVCERCAAGVRTMLGTHQQRAWGALGLGLGASILGIVLYYAVMKITGYDIGLVTIAIAIAVSWGVRKGSRNIGGRGYQFLAVGLTYFAIVVTYMILLLQGMQPGSINPFTIALSLPLAIIAPFLGLPGSILSICIIGFGLYEAWKLTRIPELVIEGPFEIDAE